MSMDLFASRLNRQLPRFASWHPDPDAEIVNAFSILWNREYYYLFPPDSLISRCLRKIQEEQTECVMVVQLWPTQIWYSVILGMLIDNPVVLRVHKKQLLTLPNTSKIHPLEHQIRLMACRLSGNNIQVLEFLKKQPTSSLRLGGRGPKNNMLHSSKDGMCSVIKGKLIYFNQM